MKENLPIWIGQNYESGGMFKSKILIVGESTYTLDGKDTSQYNLWMAQDHMDGYRDAFRTKLIRAFININDETIEDIKKFWHSVCYVNYISEPLSGPRIAPNEYMWNNNHQPLAEIIEDIKPNLVVALGYRMLKAWINNPPFVMLLGPEINGAGRSNTYFAPTSNKGEKTLIYTLRHPSSAFSWKKEHPYLMEAIRLSRHIANE